LAIPLAILKFAVAALPCPVMVVNMGHHNQPIGSQLSPTPSN